VPIFFLPGAIVPGFCRSVGFTRRHGVHVSEASCFAQTRIGLLEKVLCANERVAFERDFAANRLKDVTPPRLGVRE
jgi:hypothetical protein